MMVQGCMATLTPPVPYTRMALLEITADLLGSSCPGAGPAVVQRQQGCMPSTLCYES